MFGRIPLGSHPPLYSCWLGDFWLLASIFFCWLRVCSGFLIFLFSFGILYAANNLDRCPQPTGTHPAFSPVALGSLGSLRDVTSSPLCLTSGGGGVLLGVWGARLSSSASAARSSHSPWLGFPTLHGVFLMNRCVPHRRGQVWSSLPWSSLIFVSYLRRMFSYKKEVKTISHITF